MLTPPDVPHGIDARGEEVALVFVDPESGIGERLRARLGGRIALATRRERDRLTADLPAGPVAPDAGMRWGEAALGVLAGDAPGAHRLHPRIRRIVRLLDASPPPADTSLAALAHLAGLSESRFLHVFRASVGIPLRPYLLWRKLQRAVVALAAGAALARAAQDAGFADAAHMSRTFRRMFGTTPSALQRGFAARDGDRFVQDRARRVR